MSCCLRYMVWVDMGVSMMGLYVCVMLIGICVSNSFYLLHHNTFPVLLYISPSPNPTYAKYTICAHVHSCMDTTRLCMGMGMDMDKYNIQVHGLYIFYAWHKWVW
ncbi:hypothetical protein EON63_11870 [archaeon]|nr:MAG: hypothetical protein EON63_11870 [archaeon]